METMTSFYEYIKGCSDDELIDLAKECCYARQYGYFETKSKCHTYMTDIIVSEHNRRCGSAVMFDMVIVVAQEVMERAVKNKEDEPVKEEQNRYYNVSFHLNYSDGRQGFGDSTMYVKPGQKFTRYFLKRQLELIKNESGAESIVCISFSKYEE